MFRSYAVVPAAGRSVRMGRHKLLMPWGDVPLIEHVLSAWLASRVHEVVVVVRPDDEPLRRVCEDLGVTVVAPEVPPEEMRVSVRCAVRHLRATRSPAASDVWMLAPADMPGLSAELIHLILDAHRPESPRILVPTHGARRGHPVLFPWPLADRVERLRETEGVNALLEDHPVRAVPCPDPACLRDVDSPADLEALEGPD